MDKMKMHSPDLSQDNVAKIRALFPDCVTEAVDEQGNIRLAIDFDQLRQTLSDHIVEGPQERYRLDWPGKREALLTANAPIAKTLRPSRKESVDFDTTQNLFIEGDNLDALKLLQESYLGKVKMIYIDPPYNTGNDFIYDDDFAEGVGDFLAKSNQEDDLGRRLVANTESNGRFHSDWLSFILPRLKLCRNLLSPDGCIFISINDSEAANLRKICDEIFGADKFVGSFVWKSRQNKDNRNVTRASIDHEYVLCYGDRIRGDLRDASQYTNPDRDPRGDWASGNMVGIATADRRPNLHYDLINPATGVNYGCPDMGWRYEPSTMRRLIQEDRILWPKEADGRPRRKVFLSELESDHTGFSSVIGSGVFTRDGTAEINELMGERVFTFPKPTKLMTQLIEQGAENGGIILDFFSGSGSTADAVMRLNAQDGKNRMFISVQLPEPLSEGNQDQRTGALYCKKYKFPQNIAEISKERIRRAGQKVLAGHRHDRWNQDVGFRVLKIDSSNMSDVYYRPDEVNQDELFGQVDSVKPDRTGEDLLFQVLLDWGVELTLSINRETLHGKTVYSVDGNALIACFDTGVTDELVKEIAARAPLRAVFRDTSFARDADRINAEQLFRQLCPVTELKAI